jgi:GrpB-like predicted nucleotidyltransferase (UPF0157 family)
MDDTHYPAAGLVDHDPAWADEFAVAAVGLRRVLGEEWVVEHIGSTSVPGLLAKPVIDLAVRVPDGASLAAYDGALADAGWLDVGKRLATHDVRMRMRGRERTHIAHFFLAEDWETAHQRLFAARLREHPQERDRYGALKRQLWSTGTWGSAYTAAKSALVEEVVNAARRERGLAPVVLADKG